MVSERGGAPEDRIAAGLGEQGWAVEEGFLAVDLVAALAAEARAMRDGGALRPARVGRGAERTRRPEIRGDRIGWIDAQGASAAQQQLLGRFETLRLALNRALFLGLFELELHVSVYAPGARYRRHLDRFRGAGHRVVSCVAYLNRDWDPAAGGALRLHLDGERFVDVPPEGGTLLAFLSERFEHEVLPAARERLSIAGWFRRSAGAPLR